MRIHELRDKIALKSASEILKILNINSVPLDIENILRQDLGISINKKLEWEKLALDGSVYINVSGEIEIWINTSMPENRQNFTLAHELGHIVNDILPNIEKYENPINDNYETLYRNSISNIMEKRANNFAAQFLMPAHFIDIEATNLANSESFKNMNLQEVIQAMANRFRVSFLAMKYRLAYLGYIPRF